MLFMVLCQGCLPLVPLVDTGSCSCSSIVCGQMLNSSIVFNCAIWSVLEDKVYLFCLLGEQCTSCVWHSQPPILFLLTDIQSGTILLLRLTQSRNVIHSCKNALKIHMKKKHEACSFCNHLSESNQLLPKARAKYGQCPCKSLL